jgi:hypothetical protein
MTKIIENLKARAAVALHPLVQRLRSLVINTTCSLMHLNSKICYSDMAHEIGWRDNLRWWIEGKLTTVFSWAWDGSDEELEAVENDEVPEPYMSDRQRTYAASLD